MLREGWAWGKPRSGHPEGTVGAHVGDLLRTIDEWEETGPRRAELRFLALVHDSLKFQVDDALPKTGGNDHGVRARRLAERYTDDRRLLAILEEHDRPYRTWRRLRRTGRLDDEAFRTMLERVIGLVEVTGVLGRRLDRPASRRKEAPDEHQGEHDDDDDEDDR